MGHDTTVAGIYLCVRGFKEKSEKLAQSIEINSVLLSDSSTEKAEQRNRVGRSKSSHNCVFAEDVLIGPAHSYKTFICD